jgi:hypothetical protein
MTEVPTWRQWFDMIEAPIRKQSEAAVSSENFTKAMLFAQENFGPLDKKRREALTKMMHLSNVPALSDVTKLSRQIGTLTHKVDTLLLQIESMSEAIDELREKKAPSGEPLPIKSGVKR